MQFTKKNKIKPDLLQIGLTKTLRLIQVLSKKIIWTKFVF
jgi:hypothetical protein